MRSDIVRAALVLDHPAQHFARAFALLDGEPGLRAEVWYWQAPDRCYDEGFGQPVSWDVDLLDGYRWAAPPAAASAGSRRRWLVGQFRASRPDVVVCFGWATPAARLALACCGLTRTAALMYGDATWQHSARGANRLRRSAALRLVLRLCAGAVSTGTFNREFYIAHGMDPRRVWPGVCPADTEAYSLARPADLAAARAPGAPVRIGFAGKLIERKGADELIRAVAMLPRDGGWTLTIVGAGPALPGLQDLVGRLGLGGLVDFHGFANTSAMPGLLGGFDIVVVPSRLDMRVLVTIEAMAAGAAVVVSDATAVWGPGDLIAAGLTGLVFRSGDPADLGLQLKRLLGDPGLLAAIRLGGFERAMDFGPAEFARTMALACRQCADGAPARLPAS